MFVVSARWSLTLVAHRNDMGEKASPPEPTSSCSASDLGLGDLFGIASLLRCFDPLGLWQSVEASMRR